MFLIFRRRRLGVPQKDCSFVPQQFWAPENTVMVKLFSSQKSYSSVCRNDLQKSFTVSYLINSCVFLRGGLRVLLRDRNFVAPRNAALVKSFSSNVRKNDSEKSFAVSYLINSCGLSSKDAIAASTKLCFESPEKPDAVLKLLREYGFTDARIRRLVFKWPDVLVACPKKNLLPKLKFLLSIGIPHSVLAEKLSLYPFVLRRNLKNYIIPLYDYLKSLLKSDKRVVQVFSRAPLAFDLSSPKGNLSVLRERGMPESSIAALVMNEPTLLGIGKQKFAGYVDRAVEMGFDISKSAFISALRVFSTLSESDLMHKVEIYRRCGFSDIDIHDAFLTHPDCFELSEQQIMATMEYLVNTMGCKPAVIAQSPMVLNYSLEKKLKPRCLVARILNEKGIIEMTSVVTLLVLPEKKFLKSYIVKYEKDIPELLDLYISRKVKVDFSQ